MNRILKVILIISLMMSVISCDRDASNQKTLTREEHAEIMKLELTSEARFILEMLEALENENYDSARKLVSVRLMSFQKKVELNEELGANPLDNPLIARAVDIGEKEQSSERNTPQMEGEPRSVRLVE